MQVFAPIKINLSLAVIDRRADGYHLLDSVVTFLNLGDFIHALPADALSLTLADNFANAVAVEDNLVLRAALLLQQHAGVTEGAALTLHKRVPVGAGLGGGSADAAATLHLLNQLWELNYSLEQLAKLGANLGADVPACLLARPLRMEGIGEKITPLPDFPKLHGVVVYPNAPCFTPEVYRSLTAADFTASPHPDWRKQGNDLQRASVALCPVIEQALAVFAKLSSCYLSRMSGSGSACFGLFDDANSAKTGAETLKRQHPDWWIQAFETRTSDAQHAEGS